MQALLYVDESLTPVKYLDGLGRVLAKDIQFNLVYVIKPYPEMNMPEHDTARGYALLSEAKSRLIRQGCKVGNVECVIGVPWEQICKLAQEWNVEEVIIHRRNVDGPALLSVNELLGSDPIAHKDKSHG